MIIFRKPNPKTGSAAVAKDRLKWCVEVRRLGGHWEWVGCRELKYRLRGYPAGDIQSGVFRWVPLP